MWPVQDLDPITSKLQELEHRMAAMQQTLSDEIKSALTPFSSGPDSVQKRIVGEVKNVLAPLPTGFDSIPGRLNSIDQELAELKAALQRISPVTPTGTPKPIHDVIKQHVERIVFEAYQLGRVHGEWLVNHQETLAGGEHIKALLEAYISRARGEVEIVEKETTTGEHEQLA